MEEFVEVAARLLLNLRIFLAVLTEYRNGMPGPVANLGPFLNNL